MAEHGHDMSLTSIVARRARICGAPTKAGHKCGGPAHRKFGWRCQFHKFWSPARAKKAQERAIQRAASKYK